MSGLVELRERAAAKFKEAKEFADARGIEDAADPNISAEDWQQFEAILNEAKALDERFAEAQKRDGTLQSVAERMGFYHEAATGQKTGFVPLPNPSAPQRAKSLGETFVESEEWDRLQKSGALNSENASFRTLPVGQKATTDVIHTETGGPGSALVTPQFLPGIIDLPQRPLTVRQLFSQGTTTSDVVSYAAQVTFESGAAPVAQATSASTGAKPQSSVSWERRTSPVETLATWMAVTRQTLADSGQVQSLIDTQGRLMIQLLEEEQLIDGSGVSPNLLGITNTPGVQTLDLTGADNLDGFRTAMRLIRMGIARAAADGIVLNPVDSEELDLLKDDNGLYRGGNPIGNFTFGQSVWRMRRVESEAVDPGTAIVGAFEAGATVLQREGLQVLTTDSHADFFIRNLVVLLFEERLAFPVFRPSAFVVVTLADWGGGASGTAGVIS